MKKIVLFLTCCSLPLVGSYTFFKPRSISTDSTLELAMTDYYFHSNNTDNNFQLFVKPFYQSSKGSANYFLPNNKCSIILAEDGTGDVNPLWLNLIAPAGSSYHSKILLNPKIKSYGAIITCYADLCSYLDGLWASLNTAIIGVENDLNIREINAQSKGTITGFSDFCQALNNKAFSFGKMSCHAMKTHGLDDIQIKLGYDLLGTNCGSLSLYGLLTIPTGDASKAYYLFEPLVGSKHVHLGAGINANYLLYEAPCSQLSILGDLKYHYGFSSHETRSFDLSKNGDWSRYLQIVQQDEPLDTSPAINAFTFPVDITPRSSINFWTAIHCQKNNWNYEIGYNLWWRSAEKVTLKANCSNNTTEKTLGGIFDMEHFCSPNEAKTASTATISQSTANSSNPVVGDAAFTSITINDLNLCSGAHPRALSHKIYASIGYSPTMPHCLDSISIAGSYEHAHDKNALNQWAIWGTIGFNF